MSAETPVTAEDWAKAEALASEYVRRETSAKAPVSFTRYEYAPFLIAAWWEGGETFVLIYDDEIHTERGPEALPPFLAFLGPARLRAFKPSQIDRLLGILDVRIPNVSQLGRPWLENFKDYPDVYPAVVEQDGVIKYVMHYLGGSGPILPRAGGPSVGAGPSGGGRFHTGWLDFERWSFQLHPPTAAWRLEETFERPDPNP
jgi:hypothetical protein